MDVLKFINDISKAEDLRFYILDHTILIEEITSKTLGFILNVDWENSESFGFHSSSLSFNQKILIIRDLKGLNNIQKRKIDHLMFIRNKFAHVRSIKTFDDLFNKFSNGKEIKKDLDKWYSIENELCSNDSELRYKVFFFYLFLDINSTLLQIISQDAIKKGKEAGKDDLLDILKGELINHSNGIDVLSTSYEKLKSQLKS